MCSLRERSEGLEPAPARVHGLPQMPFRCVSAEGERSKNRSRKVLAHHRVDAHFVSPWPESLRDSTFQFPGHATRRDAVALVLMVSVSARSSSEMSRRRFLGTCFNDVLIVETLHTTLREGFPYARCRLYLTRKKLVRVARGRAVRSENGRRNRSQGLRGRRVPCAVMLPPMRDTRLVVLGTLHRPGT